MEGAEVRATLAVNIKDFRGRRNWSQADLAEKAGISIVYLSDIERGNKWPYLDTLVKLANAFNVEVHELLMPKDDLPSGAAAVMSRYNEETAAIFDKSLEIAKKHAMQALDAMRKKYLPKP